MKILNSTLFVGCIFLSTISMVAAQTSENSKLEATNVPTNLMCPDQKPPHNQVNAFGFSNIGDPTKTSCANTDLSKLTQYSCQIGTREESPAGTEYVEYSYHNKKIEKSFFFFSNKKACKASLSVVRANFSTGY